MGNRFWQKQKDIQIQTLTLKPQVLVICFGFGVALTLRVAQQALQARLQLVRYPYMCTEYLVLCRACYLVITFV